MTKTGLLAACLLLACAPAQAGERVASLNLCGDELALRLLDKGQVASVTWLARDPRGSNVAALAQDVPVNRGLAEEVAAVKPDLVLTGAFTTRTTSAMLHRLGVPILELSVPATLAEAYAQIEEVADRLGVPQRGAAMVAQMKQAFADLPPPPARRPTAIVLRPNGFAAGRGSLADEILSAAGFDNLAARLSPDRMGQLTLEDVVAADPDMLVINASPDSPPSLADELLRHPALAHFAQEGRVVALPPRLWACAGPELAEAARLLAAARVKAAREIAVRGATTRERPVQ
ncbi:ABC transporter substrate-binding protein [Aquabacter cavernae]|uniref:ABC transporter substrate-binding protein n=1 Tax=Aquabacter cavernae TaxID=2496029 RepID=UPI000F8CC1CF|nr:ABC transporter substrate-binding protein [Aquabacter cavernae]